MVLAPALVVNTNEKATAASVLMSIFFALIIFVFITLIFLIIKLTVSYLVAQMLFVLIELRSALAVAALQCCSSKIDYVKVRNTTIY